MNEREKVIKGLECCMAEKICTSKCPYKGQCDDGGYYYSKAIEDALSLLKAQEPIKPKVNIDTWVCGNCGTRIERQSLIGPNAVLAETFNFCPECGKAVKWDD